MDRKSLIFAVFLVLVSVLLFAIWSNAHVFAQQSPSLSSSSPPRPTSADANSPSSTTISPEIKAKICDPTNLSLKVVNTTESRICGIPKTLKPSLPATPPTSAVLSSSSPPLPQQTTTKPAVTGVTTTPKQQQQITTTNNNTVSRPTSSIAGATTAPISNPGNKLLSTSSSSGIAPQIKAVNQQQQLQPQQLPLTISNSTAGQNYTFASNSPLVDPGKLIYIGYNDGGTSSIDSGSTGKTSTKSDSHHDNNNNHDGGGSKDKKSSSHSDNKSSGHKNDGGGSKDKKSSSHSDNKSSGHKNDDSKSSSQSKDHKQHDSNGSSKGKKKSSSKGG
jgi:hypothetical protein